MNDLVEMWDAGQLSDHATYLDEFAALVGGRRIKDGEGHTASVRLPTRLAKGEAFFVRGGGHPEAILVEMKIGSSMHLEIGAKPFWSGATGRIDGEASPVQFDPAHTSAESVRRWLHVGGSAAVRGLSFGTRDSLQIWDTQTDLMSPAATPSQLYDTVVAVIELVRSLPAPVLRRRPVRLPARFAALQSLARRWAISDDLQRSEALSRAKIPTLQRLVDAVSPSFDEINAALDSAHQPLSDDLIDLQQLGEAAADAQVELGRRTSRVTLPDAD